MPHRKSSLAPQPSGSVPHRHRSATHARARLLAGATAQGRDCRRRGGHRCASPVHGSRHRGRRSPAVRPIHRHRRRVRGRADRRIEATWPRRSSSSPGRCPSHGVSSRRTMSRCRTIMSSSRTRWIGTRARPGAPCARAGEREAGDALNRRSPLASCFSAVIGTYPCSGPLEGSRMVRLVGVATRQKESENDDEGCHATAGNERGDEGTHGNLSLLDVLLLVHRLCRAGGGRIAGNGAERGTSPRKPCVGPQRVPRGEQRRIARACASPRGQPIQSVGG